MNPQIAQRIAQFMQRITMNPQEIQDFNVCMEALRQCMQPSEVPLQENEDGNSEQHTDQTGSE